LENLVLDECLVSKRVHAFLLAAKCLDHGCFPPSESCEAHCTAWEPLAAENETRSVTEPGRNEFRARPIELPPQADRTLSAYQCDCGGCKLRAAMMAMTALHGDIAP
jgi:hypothetical protein